MSAFLRDLRVLRGDGEPMRLFRIVFTHSETTIKKTTNREKILFTKGQNLLMVFVDSITITTGRTCHVGVVSFESQTVGL
jgi:hypothetical protein